MPVPDESGSCKRGDPRIGRAAVYLVARMLPEQGDAPRSSESTSGPQPRQWRRLARRRRTRRSTSGRGAGGARALLPAMSSDVRGRSIMASPALAETPPGGRICPRRGTDAAHGSSFRTTGPGMTEASGRAFDRFRARHGSRSANAAGARAAARKAVRRGHAVRSPGVRTGQGRCYPRCRGT